MGGRPLSALAIVCFPDKGDLDVLQQILAGGLSKMMEAGCVVIGGHSVRDPEIKFGYAVTGTIHPQRVWKNSGAHAGDALVLTKALGTGVISTAIKRSEARQSWIDAATRSMTTLNAKAAQIAADGQFAIHAATDITGFGLIGHAREMAAGSGVALRIEAAKIPLLEGALECVRAKFIPGGLNNNRDFAECMVSYGSNVPEELRTMLYDPQTAGGLLLAVDRKDARKITDALENAAVPAVEIGEAIPAQKPLIQVV
jgi:selenide,water dikinase